MAANSSQFPSSFISPHCVFLSFRGTDTRNTIAAHLQYNLDAKGLTTFRDDTNLQRGHEISKELLKAIQQAKVSVIVFSTNYASSSWCLDELVEILDCKGKIGQVVVPVYYNIDPVVVRRQRGSFDEAFKLHDARFPAHKVKIWRDALAKVADLSGHHLENDDNGNEAHFVRRIVDNVQKTLVKIFEESSSAQVFARDLKIDRFDNPLNWIWWTHNDSVDVAEMVEEYWLDARGKYKQNKLREGSLYEVHFKVMLKPSLRMDSTVVLKLCVPGATDQVSRENLLPKPRNVWIEVKVGEFVAKNLPGKIKFSLEATEDDDYSKTGLLIHSVWITPVNYNH